NDARARYGVRKEDNEVWVAMAVGFYAFPSRTRQSRPPAPMVLGERSPGRVGRRRFRFERAPEKGALSRLRIGWPDASSPASPWSRAASSEEAAPARGA